MPSKIQRSSTPASSTMMLSVSGNRNVYLYHQDAYLDTTELLDGFARYFKDQPYYTIEVPRDQVSVQDAVDTYLFNSQIVDLPGTGMAQNMAIVAPMECQDNSRVKTCFDSVIGAENPIQEVIYRDLRQSMRNGGGAACLRLRVVLSELEAQGVNPACVMSQSLYDTLDGWIERHYRDRLHPEDLADPALLNEVRTALDELSQILELGSIYSFQQD